MKKLILMVLSLIFATSTPLCAQQKNDAFRPKEIWKDTEGNAINAHGGGIMYH